MNFGPKLEDYLASRRGLGSRTPSKDEIQQAIASLANPQLVSYTTFETILALERFPLCNQLSLLLTGAHILPSCIRLLRGYCSNGLRLFDYVYGYLCFQVMNLSIEVAKLARVKALSEFLRLAERSSKGVREKVITEDLAIYIRKWEAKEFAPRGQFLHPANKLLGWYTNSSTGLATALSNIGGFTILDAVFLTAEIWEDRGSFLRCLRSALPLRSYAGWCGIIHLMHDTLVRMHGVTHINGQEFDETQNWTTLVDLMLRYALCAHPYEETTLSYIIKDRPNNGRERPCISALNSADVDQIVAAYISKAREQPSIMYAHATRLFGFTVTNCYLDQSTFVSNVTRIREAALADCWVQLGKMSGVGLSVWTYFTDSVLSTLIVVPAFSKFINTRSLVLSVVINEDLLDFLGYFILYPLTTKDKMPIENRWYWQRNTLKVLHQFIPMLKQHMEVSSVELANSLYSTWKKTAQSLEYCKVMNKYNSNHARDYIDTWETTWGEIGEAINRVPSQCAYFRCPAPEATGCLQCAGCLTQWYCSHRCQQAHWGSLVNPHRSECIQPLAMETVPKSQ